MWSVAGKEIAPDWLKFEPIEVLYDFDGPSIFTLADCHGDPYLAYLCDHEDRVARFLVVKIGHSTAFSLKLGGDVRSVLVDCGTRWVFDVPASGSIRCWEINSAEVPDDVLPKRGVMLWPELRSVIHRQTTRFSE